MDEVAGLSRLLGQDVSRHTLSWTQGAGGILATPRDMTRWERALYGGRVLPPKQQAELLSLVSTITGEPIRQTSPADPGGFGLGVVQATSAKYGTVWTYEGGTFGFRTRHVYFPNSGVIMAIGLNSQTTRSHLATLVSSVYDTLASRGLVPPTPVRTGLTPPR